jgi:hypothetical protein
MAKGGDRLKGIKTLVLGIISSLGIDLGEKRQQFEQTIELLETAQDGNTTLAPQEQTTTPPATPQPKNGAANSQELVAAITAAMAPYQATIDAMNKTIAKQEEERQTAATAIANQQAETRKAEIVQLLTDGLKAGKFTEKQRETWEKRLVDNFHLT